MPNVKSDDEDQVYLGLADKLLLASGYILFFPALYVILTEKRKDEGLALHAGQAMFLWIAIIALLIGVRALMNELLSSGPIPLLGGAQSFTAGVCWIYCIYCALMLLLGREVEIPIISALSRALK